MNDMLKPMEYLYFMVATLEIYAEITQDDTVRFFSKPLLIIVLAAYYIKTVNGQWSTVHKLIVASFITSWTGDVTLMLYPKDTSDTVIMGIVKSPHYFLAGLSAFLLTHILYAVAFTRVNNKKAEALFPKRFWVAVPLLIYTGILLYLLLPAIQGNEQTRPLLIPVVIYATAITLMVAFSINRYKRVNDKSFAFVFCGAALFLFSDSTLAIDKFAHPFAGAGALLMAFYIAGQYFIAKGCLQQFNSA